MATPPGAEHRDLEQRLNDLEKTLRDLTGATLRRQPVRSVTVQYDLDSTALPTDFGEVLAARQTIAVPAGYTRAQVLLFASAGATFTGSGNVGVRPIVGNSGGPAIATGTPGGPLSVSSFMARNLDQLAGSFLLRMQANTTGTVQSGTGNAHLSAAITFLR